MSEMPTPADTLADSVGVNTHMYEYGSDIPTISSRIQGLGVRHLRDAIMNNNPSLDANMASVLSSTNAKLDGYTDCPGIEYNPYSPTSPAQVQEYDAAIGNRLEAVEGPNEIDLRNDPNWVADTMACLPGLEGAEASLPFYAPSIGDQWSNAQAFGNVSQQVGYGNAHRYFNGHNPGSNGWGGADSCGVYGALSWAVCETQINSGQKPMVITETGYNTQGELDEATQAKYLSRLLFVNLNAGIKRSYLYVLKDYIGDGFGADGLIRSDDSPKPSYLAVATEIALFTDRGTVHPSFPSITRFLRKLRQSIIHYLGKAMAHS